MAIPGALVLLALCNTLHASSAQDPRFTSYTMPSPASGPCDITLGPDGAPWVQEIFNNALAHIDMISGIVTEYPIPFTVPALNTTLPKLIPDEAALLLSCALVTGADGRLYASNGLHNQLVALDVGTGVFSVYTPPDVLGNAQPLNDVTAAPDAIFFTQTTGNVITRFDLADHEFRNYEVPTKASVPVGVFYASDGGVWFCEFAAGKIGRLNPSTGVIREIDLPVSLNGPLVMRAQIGNELFFASTVGGSIGSVNVESFAVKAYPIEGKGSAPVEVCPSEEGDVWFTHLLADQLGKLTPGTGTFEEVNLPGAVVSKPVGVPLYVGNGIFCKPGNNVWASETMSNRVVRYSLS